MWREASAQSVAAAAAADLSALASSTARWPVRLTLLVSSFERPLVLRSYFATSFCFAQVTARSISFRRT